MASIAMMPDGGSSMVLTAEETLALAALTSLAEVNTPEGNAAREVHSLLVEAIEPEKILDIYKRIHVTQRIMINGNVIPSITFRDEPGGDTKVMDDNEAKKPIPDKSMKLPNGKYMLILDEEEFEAQRRVMALVDGDNNHPVGLAARRMHDKNLRLLNADDDRTSWQYVRTSRSNGLSPILHFVKNKGDE